MNKIRDLGRNVIDWGKYHVVDTTAMLTSTNPLYTAVETMVSGLSDETSIKARLYVAGLSYAGVSLLFARGRDLSRKIFGITDKTKERVQQIHDTVYTAAFNIPFCSTLYFLSGARDAKEIITATAGGVIMGACTGGLVGYGIDAFRDLIGLKESQRVPRCVRNQSPKVKKIIAAGLIGASLGLMGIIYSLTPDNPHIQQPSFQQVEQKAPSLDSILEKSTKQE